MKEFEIKGAVTVVLAGAALYFHAMIGPMIVLLIVMVADYISGMAAAWVTGTLSSRVGVIGIVKKVGYLFCVGVAVVVDYLIQTVAAGAGLNFGNFYAFGLLVTIWLILNECLSILENLDEIGVPLPKFLVAVVKRLKSSTEHKGDAEAATPEEKQPEYEHQELPTESEKWLASVLDLPNKDEKVSDSDHPPDDG